MDFSSITVFVDESGNPVTFDKILQEIHTTSRSKKGKIQAIVEDLTGKIKNAGDAAIVGPTIVDLLEVGVKNDDQLVKLAQIVQRATTRTTLDSKDGTAGLSDEEKRELMALFNANDGETPTPNPVD